MENTGITSSKVCKTRYEAIYSTKAPQIFKLALKAILNKGKRIRKNSKYFHCCSSSPKR